MSDHEPADDRDGTSFLAWQLGHYPGGHTRRSNLVLHLVTAPLFCAGTLSLAIAPFTTAWLALGGLLMVVALVGKALGIAVGIAIVPVLFLLALIIGARLSWPAPAPGDAA